jgi:hypothetical protein
MSIFSFLFFSLNQLLQFENLFPKVIDHEVDDFVPWGLFKIDTGLDILADSNDFFSGLAPLTLKLGSENGHGLGLDGFVFLFDGINQFLSYDLHLLNLF